MRKIEWLVEEYDPYILALDVHGDASNFAFFWLQLVTPHKQSSCWIEQQTDQQRLTCYSTADPFPPHCCFLWGEQLRRMQIIRPFLRADCLRAGSTERYHRIFTPRKYIAPSLIFVVPSQHRERLSKPGLVLLFLMHLRTRCLCHAFVMVWPLPAASSSRRGKLRSNRVQETGLSEAMPID